MFTGIIAAVGSVADKQVRQGEGTYRFRTGKLSLSGVALGDSIACNGACLTVTELHADGFSADLSRETLSCTTLGDLEPESAINFERALALGDALGGHMVTGHVDGVGVVQRVAPDGESVRVAVTVPGELAGYIARKGSVTMDGVSLTVNAVQEATFEVMIVPHTQAETIIRDYQTGTRVNIEVDLIARYLERMVEYSGITATPDQA